MSYESNHKDNLFTVLRFISTFINNAVVNLFLPLAFFFPPLLDYAPGCMLWSRFTEQMSASFVFNLPYKIMHSGGFIFFKSKDSEELQWGKTWLCPKTGPLTCSKYLLGSVLRFPQSHRSWTSAFPSRLKAKLLFLTTRCLAIPIDSQSDQSACCGRSGQSFRTQALSSLLNGWLSGFGSGLGWLAAGSRIRCNAHSRRL